MFSRQSEAEFGTLVFVTFFCHIAVQIISRDKSVVTCEGNRSTWRKPPPYPKSMAKNGAYLKYTRGMNSQCGMKYNGKHSCNLKGSNTKCNDTVAQLVRCRTSNQRVAGSIPGRPGHFGLFLGKAVYSILLQSTQLQNGYLA